MAVSEPVGRAMAATVEAGDTGGTSLYKGSVKTATGQYPSRPTTDSHVVGATVPLDSGSQNGNLKSGIGTSDLGG